MKCSLNPVISTSIAVMSLTLVAAATDLHVAPTEAASGGPQLSPLLQSGKKQITTTNEWRKLRETYRRRWLKVLGDFSQKRSPLNAEFGEIENFSTFTRQYIRYQIEPGSLSDGYLLKPKNTKGPFPAVVVFHPTTPLQAKGVAGLAPDYPEEKWQGVQLVQRGYVVWCPRNYIFNEHSRTFKKETDRYLANVKALKTKHPNWTGMGRMTFDAIRAADFLESLPDVDKNRIGCIGHSLGGKQALYAAAFDERYKAAVSSEGGIGLTLSNWEASWYLGAQIREPDFNLENHQVLSLVAPRAFLLLAGNSADNDKSWPFIEAVLPLYRLFGAADKVGWFNHCLGHRYGPEARAVAEEFLDRYLKP